MPTTQRPRSRRGEGETLRDDLLVAAVELIGTAGSVDQVSLRAVAAHVGVSPTAVYRHFDDHHALMTNTLVKCWRTFEAALRASQDPTLDNFTNFERMGAAYAAFSAAEPGMYRAMFSAYDSMGDDVLGASLDVFTILVDIVARLLSDNDDDRDPSYVATQVHTWVHGIVDLCRDPERTPYPASSEDLIADLAVRLGLDPR
jgi:AcrR family transcriptional regulator